MGRLMFRIVRFYPTMMLFAGWEVEVQEPHERKSKRKTYADNFKFKGMPPTEE